MSMHYLLGIMCVKDVIFCMVMILIVLGVVCCYNTTIRGNGDKSCGDAGLVFNNGDIKCNGINMDILVQN